MTKQLVWEQRSRISTVLVNPQKRLGLVGLLNILQDAAWEHAAHLGFGYEDLLARGTLWVLTKQRLTMRRWPAWGAEISLKTWSRPFQAFRAWRDFELFDGGELIGSCATEWLILDARTRRPSRLKRDDSPVRTDRRLDYDAGKIDPDADWQPLCRFQVRNSDQDMQGHVNNTRYAQWVLDAVPPESHRAHVLKDYEVNFLAETRLGDSVQVQAALAEDRSRRFRGVRESDGKVVFLSRLAVV